MLGTVGARPFRRLITPACWRLFPSIMVTFPIRRTTQGNCRSASVGDFVSVAVAVDLDRGAAIAAYRV